MINTRTMKVIKSSPSILMNMIRDKLNKNSYYFNLYKSTIKSNANKLLMIFTSTYLRLHKNIYLIHSNKYCVLVHSIILYTSIVIIQIIANIVYKS